MKQSKVATYNSRNADKFVIRLPAGMREQVAEMARQNHRSMNAEIIATLAAKLGMEVPEEESQEARQPFHWIPAIGQAVLVKGRGQVGAIESIEVSEGDELWVMVTMPSSVSDEGDPFEAFPITDLEPFVVKR